MLAIVSNLIGCNEMGMHPLACIPVGFGVCLCRRNDPAAAHDTVLRFGTFDAAMT